MRLLTIIALILFLAISSAKNLTYAGDDEEDDDDDSGLIIATDAGFANQTDNFTAGQTIWVKASANSDGSQKRQLNLRDNNYNLLESFTFEYIGGNQFKKSIGAPQNQGYYSLEARIESPGSVTAQVKTIKVGKTSNASINVDVDVSSNGQQVLGSKPKSPTPTATPTTPTRTPSSSPEPSPTLPGASIDVGDNKSFLDHISEFFKKLFESIF